ncbi:hypothetical protein PC116_g1996 [Phytophthora cactorum]|nr:hypothetical protein Pcac1_g24616 [Phytophthora cactorum]KAG3027215.1 hypothetical protein PC120_g5511 [Phytophthora cactorum]KAG3078681.1 hypothetical protein PC121_g7172 [Phytophthora cactorum]KAG4250320.1 hypothetical protein PC116_g1996 [Phytophthora cactorum]
MRSHPGEIKIQRSSSAEKPDAEPSSSSSKNRVFAVTE